MELHTDRKITKSIASRITERATEHAGRRTQRTLSQSDVTRFVELLRKHRKTATKLRVYSSDGFVPNGYKWRADIDCIDAERDEHGAWHIGVGSVGAKRPHGSGALATVDGRAAE